MAEGLLAFLHLEIFTKLSNYADNFDWSYNWLQLSVLMTHKLRCVFFFSNIFVVQLGQMYDLKPNGLYPNLLLLFVTKC